MNPIPSLNFYKLEEINNNLCIVLKNKILLENNQNNFSSQINNNCLIQDKYLIIGARSNKDKNTISENNGGFYIINLKNEDFKIIKYITINNCNYVNCFLNFKENIFICTNSYYAYSKTKDRKKSKYELISFEFKEKELKIEKISSIEGCYFYINCNKLFLDYFIITSNKKNNSLTKINEKGNFNYKTCISIDPPNKAKEVKIKHFNNK